MRAIWFVTWAKHTIGLARAGEREERGGLHLDRRA
jgi:hypothetical protein